MKTKHKINELAKEVTKYSFYSFSIHIISLMIGFLISSILSTITTHTGDWGMMSASIIVTFNEIMSKNIYLHLQKNTNRKKFYIFNDIKIGIIYGLFVDAFKLGS